MSKVRGLPSIRAIELNVCYGDWYGVPCLIPSAGAQLYGPSTYLGPAVVAFFGLDLGVCRCFGERLSNLS